MSVYSNEDLVFLSFFSRTRWWDAERMDALGAHFPVDADIIGRVAKRTSQTDMKRRKRLCLVSASLRTFRAVVCGCIWEKGWKRSEDVGGGQQCLRVSVTDMFDHVSELPASNGCRSWDLDQREPPARRHRKWMMHTQVHTEGKRN